MWNIRIKFAQIGTLKYCRSSVNWNNFSGHERFNDNLKNTHTLDSVLLHPGIYKKKRNKGNNQEILTKIFTQIISFSDQRNPKNSTIQKFKIMENDKQIMVIIISTL